MPTMSTCSHTIVPQVIPDGWTSQIQRERQSPFWKWRVNAVSSISVCLANACDLPNIRVLHTETGLEQVGMTELPNKKLGVIQGVRCDDPRMGETVSPTLFKSTGGDDLIEWWRMTGLNRPAVRAAAE